MKIKTANALVKAGPDDGLAEGEFLVYPSTFIKRPDSYGDIVAPGAFLDDIAERKASGVVLPGLFGHRMDDPDYFVAEALEEGEDEHGWWVKGRFDMDSPKGGQVYRLAKGRRLNQLSFSYDTLDEATVTLDDGVKANELRRLKVYEFSFVPVGANQDTSIVAIKGIADALMASQSISPDAKSALTTARDSIDSVLASLKDDSAATSADADDTTSKSEASGHTEAKDEEPSPAKSEEPRVNPSARAAEQSFNLLRP